MAEDVLEQTLHVAGEVSVYGIPPRRGAEGYKSGEWKVGDKLFSGRLRVVSVGEVCEVRLEDTKNGDLFATCPVPYGMRNICIEPVADSSRYFVLRVEDPATKRHAFLGMGFEERSDAFDFTESLVRHEKYVERERAARALQGGSASASSAAAKDVEALYQQHNGDLALKQGESIRVNIKRPPHKEGTGGGLRISGSSPLLPLVPLAPPPGVPPPPLPSQGHGAAAAAAAAAVAPPQLTPSFPPPQQQQQAAAAPPAAGDLLGDLLGFGAPSALAVPQQAAPAATALLQPQQQPAQPTGSADGSWVTFD